MSNDLMAQFELLEAKKDNRWSSARIDKNVLAAFNELKRLKNSESQTFIIDMVLRNFLHENFSALAEKHEVASVYEIYGNR